MNNFDTPSWPAWPEDGLEHLGRCPICDSPERSDLYTGLFDRLFGAPGRWTMYLCAQCKSGYLDPRPNKETVALAYENYETHRPVIATDQNDDSRLTTSLRNGFLNAKYGYQMRPANKWGYLAIRLLPPPLRQEWDHFARHLPRPTPGNNKLLDVGCGNGEFLLRAQSQGWIVHGIDQDQRALAHARLAGLSVEHVDVDSALFTSESFDAITCQQVIEHVHQPRQFLARIYDWLKPNGRFWVGTPNISSVLHTRFGRDWHPLHPPQHLSIMSSKALISSLTNAGFLNARLVPRGFNETHCHRVSFDIAEGTDEIPFAIKSDLLSRRVRRCSVMQAVGMETRAWLNPGSASDMTAIATK